ncbi:hypothetical protein CROQUDRAFT_102651 [Cronartium quercuum f. sp. fusiforme G11]|uniref:Uncharacterized protein n=1 Tax=Cronartium quercuum f. sp. fusiforme G11 TaxID=708437 RepID=A0A9P6T606_9BASI|nr:hypothetical protein CROQUDRAFT_102651 [Cronartium quercuum f. sp. fusiforme G11]
MTTTHLNSTPATTQSPDLARRNCGSGICRIILNLAFVLFFVLDSIGLLPHPPPLSEPRVKSKIEDLINLWM